MQMSILKTFFCGQVRMVHLARRMFCVPPPASLGPILASLLHLKWLVFRVSVFRASGGGAVFPCFRVSGLGYHCVFPCFRVSTDPPETPHGAKCERSGV